MISPEQDFPEAYNICQQYVLTEEQMHELVRRLTQEIELGLARRTHARSTVKSFITYVQELPTGKERGKYLVLDLGGSNIVVSLVYIKSATDVETHTKSFELHKNLMVGTARRLFMHLVSCLAQFCHEMNVAMENLPLGFTFSFPCEHKSVHNAVLVQWTKAFDCTESENLNVMDMLRKALKSRDDIRVRPFALLNDTTAALLTGASQKPNCRIGLVVGSGTNACYVEKTANTQMLRCYKKCRREHMVVNCEWGTFGDNGELDFIRTAYDRAMDELTSDPMRSTFQKCVSGVYLGEIVRQILVELMQRDLIFKNRKSNVLEKPWSIDLNLMSEIESDLPDNLSNTAMILNRLGITTFDESDLTCVRYVCETVSNRSAMLVACGLVALIKKMDIRDEVTVSVDGNIYRHHPSFHRMLMKHVNQLLQDSVKVEMFICATGTYLGTALQVAHCTCKR